MIISHHASRALRACYRSLVCGGVALVLVFSVGPRPAHAATEPWLARLNQLRVSADLPAATGNLEAVQGRWLHSRYQAMNGRLSHTEDPSNAWYTADGAKHTGNACAAEGGADAIDCWAMAPYHVTILLQAGRQSYGMSTFEQSGKVASTLELGWDFGEIRAAPYPVLWPGPGSTVPYTRYWGGENPDPMAGSGYTNPIGLPIVVVFNSARTFSNSRLSCNGAALTHFVRTWGTSTAFIIPRRPLERGETYDVAITASGTTYRWSFSVGQRRASSLSIAGPEYADAGKATLSFTVRDGGLPSAKLVCVERSSDGSSWQSLSSKVTSSLTGSGAVPITIASPTYFRARFGGDELCAPATSAPILVNPEDLRVPTALSVDPPLGSLVGSTITLWPHIDVGGTAWWGWATVALERSPDGSEWAEVRRYSQAGIVGKPILMEAAGFYRLRFLGDAEHQRSTSAAWRVGATDVVPAPATPHRLALSPLATTSLRVGRAFGVSGSLLPRHTSAPRSIRVQALRQEGGRWVLRHTFVGVSSGAAPDRFTATVKLASRGKWALRATVPADSTHSSGVSTYRYGTAR